MSLPLKGLKVLDFTTLLPGPYATHLLADMGAEVLRVESPTRTDLLKLIPPYVGRVSAAHATINRNKKSIAIDLKHDKATSVIEKLLEHYDVIIEQFRPGVMSRLGLGYELLSKKFPKLIYCSITGYGQTGKMRDRAGHDINYLALSGLASYSGTEQTGPVLSSTQIADLAGGSHHAVMSILAAVIARQSTNLGQYLDISMTDAAFSLNTMFGANALANGKDPELGSEMLNGGSFYGYYKTVDERYLSIGSLEPAFAKQLLSTLKLETFSAKMASQSPVDQNEIKEAIQKKIETQTLAHWVEAFSNVDACVEPVLTLNEAAESDWIVSRNMVVDVPIRADDKTGKTVRQINSALPFKDGAGHIIGQEVGANTIEVLEESGVDARTIQELLEAACIKVAYLDTK